MGDQFEFSFMEKVKQDEGMDEIAKEAKKSFEDIIKKYKITPEERANIYILAQQF